MSILTMESWPRHVVGGPDSLNGAMLEVADNGVKGAGGTAAGTARPTGGHQPEGHRRVGYKWPWHKGALVSFLCLSCGSWTRLRNEQPTGGKATGEVAQRFRYQFPGKIGKEGVWDLPVLGSVTQIKLQVTFPTLAPVKVEILHAHRPGASPILAITHLQAFPDYSPSSPAGR